MALTPEEQAELDQLTGMMIPASGAATNPANQAVLQQVASNPNEDIAFAQDRVAPAPATNPNPNPNPNLLNNYEAFNRGTGILSSVQPGQQTKLTADDVNEAFLSIPGMPALTEYAQSFNKSVADTIDFLGPDVVNSILEIGGSDKRVPTASGALEELTGGEQQFMEPGLARDAVKLGGEYSTLALGMSQLLKKLPGMLPAFAETSGKSQIGVGMAEQLGKNTRPVADTAMGALTGVGSVYGKAAGDFFGPNAGALGEGVGSILAPLSLGITTPIITNMFKNNGAGVAQLAADLDRFSVKEAGKILAAQLESENMTVDQAVKKFNSLGTDAMPADIGASFRSKLREAANVFPRVFGAANEALINRNKDQPRRILNAFDDASETSMLELGTETQRLDEVFKPQVKALYDAAREKDLPLTKPILKMIEDSPTLSKAANSARDLLNDARAIGERPGTIDFINNIKLVLDDQVNKLVSQGAAESGKIANLVKLKTSMLRMVDELLPEYKVAREEFADLAQLKAAGDVGINIFKISDSPADFKALVDSMNPAQLKLAKLGVKEAIIKKFNDSQETANTIKSMFGKRGSIQKAEYLWGDTKEGKAQFKKFQDALEIEMEYAFTKNELGNSTTAKQMVEIAGGQKNAALEALAEQMKNKRTFRDRIGSYLIELNKPKEVAKLAEPLETAGDFLFMKGLTGEEVRKMLKHAEPKDVQKILMECLEYTGIPDSVYSVPAVNIGVGQALQDTINE